MFAKGKSNCCSYIGQNLNWTCFWRLTLIRWLSTLFCNSLLTCTQLTWCSPVTVVSSLIVTRLDYCKSCTKQLVDMLQCNWTVQCDIFGGCCRDIVTASPRPVWLAVSDRMDHIFGLCGSMFWCNSLWDQLINIEMRVGLDAPTYRWILHKLSI